MHTVIIAEAGVNHNGSLERAKEMVDVAADAGVDYIKFQTFQASKLVSKNAQKAEYQRNNSSNSDNSQYMMLKELELTEEMHHELISYCEHKKITFLSTAFDSESIELLDKLGIDLFKVPSGEITNKPYLEHIARKGRPVIISTGMADLAEIKNALDILVIGGIQKDKITVLHCNTEYPTPMEDVNLKAMLHIGKELEVEVGYSDHTNGIEVSIAAVALGAKVIEKHFTLDRDLPGPDHKASLEPEELKAMVKAVRNIEKAMGDGIKRPSLSERKNIVVARKSIHIAKRIGANTMLTNDVLTMKRPGDGISPMELNKVIGKKVLKDLDTDYKLTWEDIE